MLLYFPIRLNKASPAFVFLFLAAVKLVKQGLLYEKHCCILQYFYKLADLGFFYLVPSMQIAEGSCTQQFAFGKESKVVQRISEKLNLIESVMERSSRPRPRAELHGPLCDRFGEINIKEQKLKKGKFCNFGVRLATRIPDPPN